MRNNAWGYTDPLWTVIFIAVLISICLAAHIIFTDSPTSSPPLVLTDSLADILNQDSAPDNII